MTFRLCGGAPPDPFPRVGIRIPPCAPATTVAETVQRAELAGFSSAWLPDSHLLWRDVYVALALAADRTRTITLGTAVTNVRSRHLSVTASAINALDEIAPGRIVLGMGVGSSAVAAAGAAAVRSAELRDAVGQIRSLLGGGTVPGSGARLLGAHGECPVYLAASGPRNLALAGAIADGVIMNVGFSEELLRRGIALVEAGAWEAGRSLKDITIVAVAYASFAEPGRSVLDRLKPKCVAIAQHGGQAALAALGIDLPDPGPIEGVTPDMNHAEDLDRAIEAAATLVDDDAARRFADGYALYGTDEQMQDKLRRAAEMGVDAVFLDNLESYSLPDAFIDQAGHRLLSTGAFPTHHSVAAPAQSAIIP